VTTMQQIYNLRCKHNVIFTTNLTMDSRLLEDSFVNAVEYSSYAS